MSVVDVAINRDSGFGVGPIRRKGRSGRRSSGSHTKQQFSPTPEANTTSNYMAGHPSLSYFPGTFAHPGLLAPAFTPRDEPPPPPPLYPSTTTRSSYTTSLANRNSCLSQTVCPQQTQSTQTTDAPSMETHYIPSRILSPIPTMRRSPIPNDPINPILARPPSPPRSRRRTTSPLAPESHHRQRPNRPRFPRSKIEPSLLRVALMTQLIKRCKASDEYDTIPLKGGAGGVVIMQKLSRSRPISAVPKYSERPATPSGIVGC